MTLEDTLFHRSRILHRLICTRPINLTQKLMWAQDWLRRFRSGKIISVELTGRNDAAIANRQSTWASLENAGFDILVLDDDLNVQSSRRVVHVGGGGGGGYYDNRTENKTSTDMSDSY